MKAESGRSNSAFVPDEQQQNNNNHHHHQVVEKKTFVIELSEKRDNKDQDDYDPYKHRNVKHPTTNMETLIHLLKGSLGTGILAMPMAFYHAGYLIGSIGTLLIGILCTYCIHQLIKAEYELCSRKKIPSLNYPAVAEAALMEGPGWCRACSPYIVNVVNTFLLIYQLGTCCVYVVFVSSNIKSIVDLYVEEKTDVRLYMLIILLPLILINWVRNLKYLAPFSTIANGITLVSFGIILYYIFREPISFGGLEGVGQVRNWPLFFGTVLFALEAIGVILPLENEMKTPNAFGGSVGVLNRAMVVIVSLYIGMGLFGYMKFGPKVLGSITLNLPDEIMAQCVKGMLAFAIYITHGLACYVAIDITWNDYLFKRFATSNHKVFWEYVTRTVLTVITFLLAVAIPNLELFISLFGALCLSALGLAFPAWIQFSTHYYESKGSAKIWLIFKNAFIATVGLVGLVVGTYTSLNDIIVTVFQGGSEENH